MKPVLLILVPAIAAIYFGWVIFRSLAEGELKDDRWLTSRQDSPGAFWFSLTMSALLCVGFILLTGIAVGRALGVWSFEL